ncbi:hypothetical protein B0H13DRAFT_1653385, partial [Mycena leptocephala]
IFETTALMYPGETPTLLRVARRVLIWIEPLLYRIVRVEIYNKDRIMNAIKSKPADFFAKAVRHLCLSDLTHQEARQILEVCSGVTNLGMAYGIPNPDLLPIITNLPLQRLATSLCDLFREAIVPRHASITHLALFDPSIEDVTQLLTHIPTFPVLSHIAVGSEEVTKDMAQTLLGECPRLMLLIQLWFSDDEYEWAQIPHAYDVRFVMALCPENAWRDWEAGAKGLPHFWSRGDDFVTLKRRKEIEGAVWFCH